jgi:anti-sigma B factor antagonist
MALLETLVNNSPGDRESPIPAVIWLRGEHDASTVPALSRTLDRVVAQDTADVVIDLSDVQFMGAATIGAIVRVRGALGVRSRSLSLRAPSTCARRLIDLCGLSDMVSKTPSNVAA